LETDRGCALIVDAAVGGLIDFSKARLLDGNWWKRLTILLDGLERKKTAETVDAAYRFYLAQLANGSLTSDSFKQSQDSAQDTFESYLQRIKPWHKGKKERNRQMVDEARQAYINAFGEDPADPEFKRKAEEEAARWLKSLEEEKAAKVTNNPQLRVERQRAAQAEKRQKRRRSRTPMRR